MEVQTWGQPGFHLSWGPQAPGKVCDCSASEKSKQAMPEEGEAERGGLSVSKDVQAAAGVCKVTTIPVTQDRTQL